MQVRENFAARIKSPKSSLATVNKLEHGFLGYGMLHTLHTHTHDDKKALALRHALGRRKRPNACNHNIPQLLQDPLDSIDPKHLS